MLKKIIRTDLHQHSMNAGKQKQLHELLQAFRAVAVQQSKEQWRFFFTTGGFIKNLPAAQQQVATRLNAPYVQMARAQVVQQLESWVSNRANEFKSKVLRSSLTAAQKHQLLTINKLQAWYLKNELPLKDGSVIPPDMCRLARTIMRNLRHKCHKPRLNKLSMLIDQRCVELQPAKVSTKFKQWLRISTLVKGSRISVPLIRNSHHAEREGELAKTIALIERDGELQFGLMKNVAAAFETSKAAYEPKSEVLALDTGLVTLFATDQGDLVGRNYMQQLMGYDRRITKLAAYRQKHGLTVASARYKQLVHKMRSWLKCTINRVLNRLIDQHAPVEIVVENLHFQDARLSRRLNRLLRNFGQTLIREKLADLKDRFGIETVVVNPAYTSQTHYRCGYTAKENRISQATFVCRWCGGKEHADVNAARNLRIRRSDSKLSDIWARPAKILYELRKQFIEKQAGRLAKPFDLRLQSLIDIKWKPDQASTRFCT